MFSCPPTLFCGLSTTRLFLVHNFGAHCNQRRVVHRRIPQISCRASTAGSSTSFSTGPTTASRPGASPTQEDLSKRAAEFSELLQETARLAASTGPRGYVRAFQGARAVLSVGQEYVSGLQAGRQLAAPVVLRKLFEKLGATYIKLGQFIASSPTLFPEEYVIEFQKCLDRTDPVPWDVIRRTLQSDLGQPIDEVFSYIDPTPLASASIAQVHSAVLKDSNMEVVIKVLKPGVEDILIADLNFLYLATRYLEFINPELSRTSLAGIVGDIRLSMMDEVDFVKESQHIAQFSNYLDRSGMRRVATCPFVYKQYTSKRVMVMEKLNGVALTDLAAIRSMTSADPETVLISALNTWFGSLVACDTFHADVHAGNLLVLRDGRVGFIDFGIVGRVSTTTWAAMESLLLAISTEDYTLMAESLVAIGATSEQVNMNLFADDLRRLFSSIQQLDSEVIVRAGPQGVAAGMAFDDAQLNRLLLDLVQVSDTHGIKFPREFGLLLKQLLYFDRYTKILAPTLQVYSDSRVNLGSAAQSYGM